MPPLKLPVLVDCVLEKVTGALCSTRGTGSAFTGGVGADGTAVGAVCVIAGAGPAVMLLRPLCACLTADSRQRGLRSHSHKKTDDDHTKTKATDQDHNEFKK